MSQRRKSTRPVVRKAGGSRSRASAELATLTALAQALSGPAELTQSLEAALTTVADVLGLETGWVWLLDEHSAEPRLAAARALPQALRDHPDAMHGDCFCLKTFRAGDLRGAANVNVVWCSRLAVLIDDDRAEDVDRLQCHASVPLVVGDKRLGMLNMASRDWRVLSDAELGLLTTAGALVSLAVERSRLEAASASALAAEERNRLAREIHDTLAQSLAALTMQLEVADTLASDRGDDARLAGAVARALALARTTLDEARRSVLDLREAPLDGLTLQEAIEGLATRGGNGRPRVDVVATDVGHVALAPAFAGGLYRIAQQAVANAMRHAGAGRIAVRLTHEDGALRLRIEDDGRGFAAGSVPTDRFGLVGMRERARLLGGTLVVESALDAGTVIDVRVPDMVREPPARPESR
jgi:two-component system NarL family sensor kinase